MVVYPLSVLVSLPELSLFVVLRRRFGPVLEFAALPIIVTAILGNHRELPAFLPDSGGTSSISTSRISPRDDRRRLIAVALLGLS